MNGYEGAWFESDLYCSECNEAVMQKNGTGGFIFMRCACVEKAGHREIEADKEWFHKSCRGDERAMRMEHMHEEMDAYTD